MVMDLEMSVRSCGVSVPIELAQHRRNRRIAVRYSLYTRSSTGASRERMRDAPAASRSNGPPMSPAPRPSGPICRPPDRRDRLTGLQTFRSALSRTRAPRHAARDVQSEVISVMQPASARPAVRSVDRLTDRIREHLSVIAEIAPGRPPGSPANRSATAYVEEILRSAGLSPAALSFRALSWQPGRAMVDIDGHSSAIDPPPFCRPADVSGPAAILDTLEELRQAAWSPGRHRPARPARRRAVLPEGLPVRVVRRAGRGHRGARAPPAGRRACRRPR